MVVKTQKALVSKKRTTHGNRPKTGRDSQAQVSLDNAHAVIDGATETLAPTHRNFREIKSLPGCSGLARNVSSFNPDVHIEIQKKRQPMARACTGIPAAAWNVSPGSNGCGLYFFGERPGLAGAWSPHNRGARIRKKSTCRQSSARFLPPPALETFRPDRPSPSAVSRG